MFPRWPRGGFGRRWDTRTQILGLGAHDPFVYMDSDIIWQATLAHFMYDHGATQDGSWTPTCRSKIRLGRGDRRIRKPDLRLSAMSSLCRASRQRLRLSDATHFDSRYEFNSGLFASTADIPEDACDRSRARALYNRVKDGCCSGTHRLFIGAPGPVCTYLRHTVRQPESHHEWHQA